jgi:hypothetical protein
MRKAIFFSAFGIAALLSVNASFAQNVEYDWNITNSWSHTIIEDGTPTTTGYEYPYMPNGLSPGANVTLPTTEKSSYTTTKFYVGHYVGSPYYEEFSCQFTVNGGQVNSDGTCTAPTGSAAAYTGAAGSPMCSSGSVTPVGTGGCHYQINFTYNTAY